MVKKDKKEVTNTILNLSRGSPPGLFLCVNLSRGNPFFRGDCSIGQLKGSDNEIRDERSFNRAYL